MTDPSPSLPSRILGWLSRLSLPMLAAIGVVLAGGVGAGGFYAYRTYNYVQHDNQFCLSCHLMEHPYQKFSRSAHRGLGCHACHQPTFLARSSMALTQIIENPESLDVHAEVPNARCESCHVKGDPKKWRIIENTAGHKVHLESKNPKLKGLQCVTCHGVSLHEFTAVDQTCAQAGCHSDIKVRLGDMTDLTVHCQVCHSFVAPVDSVSKSEAANAVDALLPNQSECLSCHAMRMAMKMPNPDPHQGKCASCHNPHVQKTPQDAWKSCTKAGCHTQPDTLTPFHRGLPPGVLESCQTCHKAHDFSLNGNDCGSCHKNIAQGIQPPPGFHREGMRLVPDSGRTPPDTGRTLPRDEPWPKQISARPAGTFTTGPPKGGAVGPLAMADLALYLRDVGALRASRAGQQTPPDTQRTSATQQQMPRIPPQGPTFNHAQHRTVSCTRCHQSTGEHGGLVIKTLEDCRNCHHTQPVADDCVVCHDSPDRLTKKFSMPQVMKFSFGKTVHRDLTFTHAPHKALDCSECHTEGPDRSAQAIQCSSCHAQHHQPTNDCTVCHRQPPPSAHPPEVAHVTCTGSSCHKAPPFKTVPRTRQACLVCHQDLRDHRPGQECADCHLMPAPRGG
jgi:nitrate/TMAO reductase-like tetraheme cytochrome c subunit